jgi:hypothetical protein
VTDFAAGDGFAVLVGGVLDEAEKQRAAVWIGPEE